MRHFVIVSMVITATLLTFRLVASAQQVAPGQTADAKPPRPGLEVPLVLRGRAGRPVRTARMRLIRRMAARSAT